MSKCPDCNGEGSVDTGGFTPWGAPISDGCSTCKWSGEANDIGPRWMDRPTTPGIYVCQSDDPQRFRMTAMELDQADLDRGAPFHTKAVFGPIPKPPCEYCGGIGSIKVDFEHPQWITCEACK